MAQLPNWLMPHTVTVETLTGGGAYGDTYAAPVQVRCWRDEKRRLVRDAAGDQIVSETTLAAAPDSAPLFAEGSRVTIAEADHVTTVISTRLATDGGLGGWQHCQVTLA